MDEWKTGMVVEGELMDDEQAKKVEIKRNSFRKGYARVDQSRREKKNYTLNIVHIFTFSHYPRVITTFLAFMMMKFAEILDISSNLLINACLV